MSSLQWTTLEGVFTASTSGGASGNYFDYTAFEETNVQTFGKTAAIPARGVMIEAVAKTGGNDFHGAMFYSTTNSSLQIRNLTSALAAQGLTGQDHQTL